MVWDTRVPRARVEAIKAPRNLVIVASQIVDLKQRGNQLYGLCPLHSEKTPSFSVDPEAGTFYCFGCQKGGDVIQLVRLLYGLNFRQALTEINRIVSGAEPRKPKGAGPRPPGSCQVLP